MLQFLDEWRSKRKQSEVAALAEILLVDDHVSSLLALEEIFSGLDATLFKATSAKDALRIMMEQKIDCILLDVSMPGMDGFDFLRTLHQAPAHTGIPVIMMTGKIFSENETLKAYKHGAVDFLLKPLQSEIVYRKVSFFVDQAHRVKRIVGLEDRMKRLSEDVLDPLQALQGRGATPPDLDTSLGDVIDWLKDLENAWGHDKYAK